MQKPEVNLNLIRNAAALNPKHKAILEHYAVRQRGRQNSTVDRMVRMLRESGVDANQKDVAEFFVVMQEANAGTYVSGRHGKQGRLLFNVDLVTLAKAALTEAIKPESIAAAPKTKVRLPKLVMSEPKLKAVPSLPQAKAAPAPTVTQLNTRAVRVTRAGFDFEFPADILANPIERKEMVQFLAEVSRLGT